MSEIVIQGTTPGIRVSGTGAQVTVKVTTGSGGGGGGVTDHNALTGRSDPDQHPIGAVTGLQGALDGKVSTSDQRLSDARTPTAHKVSHATGGTDPLTPADIGAADASALAGKADLVGGLVVPSQLASGTPAAGTVPTSDGAGSTVWGAVSGGGPVYPDAVNPSLPGVNPLGVNSNINTVSNQMLGAVLVTDETLVISEAHIIVGANAPGVVARLGMFPIASGIKTRSLSLGAGIDFGKVFCDTKGQKTATLVSPVSVPAGAYWLGLVSSETLNVMAITGIAPNYTIFSTRSIASTWRPEYFYTAGLGGGATDAWPGALSPTLSNITNQTAPLYPVLLSWSRP